MLQVRSFMLMGSSSETAFARTISSRPSFFPPVDNHAKENDFATLLRSCSSARDLEKAKRVYQDLSRSEHRHSRFLNNLVIEMFGKCGSVTDARLVFDEVPFPNTFSWNILMSAYIQNGCLRDAHQLFLNSPHRDVVSWTTMVSAYAQNGHLLEARKLFDKMPGRNLVSWNAMIAGYVQNGEDEQAVSLFYSMDQLGASPNQFTLASILDAYGNLGDVSKGEFTHKRVIHQGYVSDVVIQTSLIVMHGKLGEVGHAEEVFKGSHQQDFVLLTAMIQAYGQNRQVKQAENLFDKAPCRDVVLWTGMLTAYAQGGELDQARRLFNEMPEKNVVTWSAMIAANAQNGCGKEAVKLFKLMDLEGFFPNQFTLGSLIDACSEDPTLAEARLVHSVIKENGFKLTVVLSSALINMYGKCGCLELAREVFDTMKVKNVVSWNTMIAIHAENGHGAEALRFFSSMHLEGVEADHITLSGALGACNHAGLLEDGREFMRLGKESGVELSLENFTCMIDLLGKSGRLSEAEELIREMPFDPGEVTWTTLLSSCKTHNDGERAARIGQRVLRAVPESSATYVMLCNVQTSSN